MCDIDRLLQTDFRFFFAICDTHYIVVSNAKVTWHFICINAALLYLKIRLWPLHRPPCFSPAAIQTEKNDKNGIQYNAHYIKKQLYIFVWFITAPWYKYFFFVLCIFRSITSETIIMRQKFSIAFCLIFISWKNTSLGSTKK